MLGKSLFVQLLVINKVQSTVRGKNNKKHVHPSVSDTDLFCIDKRKTCHGTIIKTYKYHMHCGQFIQMTDKGQKDKDV